MKLSLNKPITFKTSSHRYFYKGERHVDRICVENVLLLVYDGELAFGEDGKIVKVKKGEYYIQRAGLKQSGDVENDAPNYYYIHFEGLGRDVNKRSMERRNRASALQQARRAPKIQRYANGKNARFL